MESEILADLAEREPSGWAHRKTRDEGDPPAVGGRRQFEDLVTDLMARFARMPDTRIDREVAGALRSITEHLGLDQAFLVQWTQGRGLPSPAQVWTYPDGVPVPISGDGEGAPWTGRQAALGRIVMWSSLAELPSAAGSDRDFFRAAGTRSLISLPLKVRNGLVGAVALASLRREMRWTEQAVRRLQCLADILAGAVDRRQRQLAEDERLRADASARRWMEEQLQARLEEIGRLKRELEQENVSLRGEINLLSPHGAIAGRSDPMKRILHLAEVVAPTDTAVLLTGETGTGKDLIARAIHGLSPRSARALVAVNCAALPANLVEAELFGHEKGAYTGALAKIEGRFEVADRSTLFLDEIGELPLETQAKLLRVVEDGRFERLGSSKSVSVNVRIIAATNRDLERQVREGKFREDLYYRLNVFPIHIPPLRERPEDIPDLVWAFVRQFETRMRKRIEVIRKRTLEDLQRYSWPGNARELRNVIEHAMIVSTGKTLEARVPKPPAEKAAIGSRNLRDVEREHILEALSRTGWRIMGKGGAAELLGLKRTTLYGRMKKLGIDSGRR